MHDTSFCACLNAGLKRLDMSRLIFLSVVLLTAGVTFQMTFFQSHLFQSPGKRHVDCIIRTSTNLAQILTVCFVSGSFLVMFSDWSVHLQPHSLYSSFFPVGRLWWNRRVLSLNIAQSCWLMVIIKCRLSIRRLLYWFQVIQRQHTSSCLRWLGVYYPILDIPLTNTMGRIKGREIHVHAERELSL